MNEKIILSNEQKYQQAQAELNARNKAHQLVDYAENLSWAWEEDKNRVCKHLVMEYIDYFGSWQWAMRLSLSPVPGKPAARITHTVNEADTEVA